eukprot:gene36418-44178_t
MTSRFYVINCENSTKWSPIDFAQMFTMNLAREGDDWRACQLASGENLPDDVRAVKGIVITGSRFNCRDRDSLPWFESLCELIRFAAEHGSPKIYGGCFGCQIIAHALGGEVDYNPTRRFLLKAESVKFLDCNCGCMGLPSLPSELEGKCCCNGLKLLVSHGDCVCKLPPNAKLLAKSDTCEAEIYLTGNGNNIIGCQSHPEFDFKYAVEDRIWKSVVELNNRLNEEEIAIAKQSFAEYDGMDARYFMNWVSSFLHS